jgi:hypothetical protein
VDIKDSSSVRGSSTILVSGNSITLTIVPATPAWRNATFRNAVATLDRPAPAGPPADPYYHARSEALNTLRFLGSPAAIRELVNRLRGDPVGGGDSICVMGLLSAPDPAVARQALEDAVEDPDRPVHVGLLSVLALLDAAPRPQQRMEAQQRALETLVRALPQKRGRATAISVMTAVNQAWNSVPLPESTTRALVQQLIARFDELPVERQAELLETRWDKIGGAALLPILRCYAGTLTDSIDPNSPEGYAARRLAAAALRHWYELDPTSARPAVLAEISRPSPRFGAGTVGLLPDAVLPGVELQLAVNFAKSNDLDTSVRIASLIARYASGAVLPSVLARLDPQLGMWACDIQAPILAYALRVDPVLARPRIEKALATRQATGCYRDLLTSIANIFYDPILEDLARRSLDDANPRVRSTSASLLGRFGSPAMEAVLFERYSKWLETWQGRESELTPAFADDRAQQDAINEGASLLVALTTATSWLTGEEKLKRLLSMTKALRLRQQLESTLASWRTMTITLSSVPWSTGIDAHVAQYQLQSMQALENKLGQFPAGTRFLIRVSGPNTAGTQEMVDAVERFVRAHGMTAVARQ